MNQNTITWSAVSGAVSYNIYWSTTPGVTKATGTKIPSVTSPYAHVGLTSGTTYYYIVTAFNNSGESEPSPEVFAKVLAPAAAPTAVRATPDSGSVSLAWTPVTGATSYNIYYLLNDRGVNTANGIKIAGVSNPFKHTGLINGTTYYYAVTAVVDGIESAPAPVVSAIPAVNPAPASPFNLKATSGNYSGIQGISISWDKVPDAISYNAYFSDTPGVTKDNGIKMAGVTSTLRPALQQGTYYFVLTAVGVNGESTISPEMTLLTPIFTTDLVSGKNIKYTDSDTKQVFSFTCRPNGTLTFTSNLAGVPASGTGTWSVNPEVTLTVAIPSASLTLVYEVFTIYNNGATIGVNFYKGSEPAAPGNMTVN